MNRKERDRRIVWAIRIIDKIAKQSNFSRDTIMSLFLGLDDAKHGRVVSHEVIKRRLGLK